MKEKRFLLGKTKYDAEEGLLIYICTRAYIHTYIKYGYIDTYALIHTC